MSTEEQRVFYDTLRALRNRRRRVPRSEARHYAYVASLNARREAASQPKERKS